VIHNIQQLLASAWNRIVSKGRSAGKSDLVLGYKRDHGEVGKTLSMVPEAGRTEHIVILGKTGTGKSSLMKHFVLQDIHASRGFVFFDLHGDAQSFLLSAIAEQERVRNTDLSRKVIVIEPGDPEYSVGLNVLEPEATDSNFVQISEFAQILKQRWHLDALGARTEELLRNTLYVLSENHLMLPFGANVWSTFEIQRCGIILKGATTRSADPCSPLFAKRS
jgi:energy-coupling factor transporter ATP-binding protein EcfA2